MIRPGGVEVDRFDRIEQLLSQLGQHDPRIAAWEQLAARRVQATHHLGVDSGQLQLAL